MWSLVLGGLGKAGSWLLRNPAVIMVVLLSAAFVMIVVSKNSEIFVLNKQSKEKDGRIAELIASLQQARSNVTRLSASLEAQNASIVQLKNQGDAATIKFDTIINGMAASNVITAKKLDALKVAKPGSDKCASALALVKGQVQ